MVRTSPAPTPANDLWQSRLRLLRMIVLLGVIGFLLWQRYQAAKDQPQAPDVAGNPIEKVGPDDGESRVDVNVVVDEPETGEPETRESETDESETDEPAATDESAEPKGPVGIVGESGDDGPAPPPLKKRVDQAKAKQAEKPAPPKDRGTADKSPPEKTSPAPSKTPATTTPSKQPAPKTPAAPAGPQTKIPNVTILDLDKNVVFQGTIDVSKTLARIEAGQRLRFRNDGVTFENRERRLPRKPPGHYHEWVHPTEELDGPGPQRIVTGEDGEIYYTHDHYGTFRRLDKPGR